MNKLTKYYRDKHGRPHGVVVAVKMEDGQVAFGWSLCHKLDKGVFSKREAVKRAEVRAISTLNKLQKKPQKEPTIPQTLLSLMDEMVVRANVYFHLNGEDHLQNPYKMKEVPLRPVWPV